MPKSPNTSKKQKRTNQHSVSLNTEAFKALRHARHSSVPATYAGAILNLTETQKTIAAPTAAIIDLTSPDFQTAQIHFTTEQTAIKGCESLRDNPSSLAALIELAADYSGLSLSDYVKVSITDAAKKRIIEHHRAQAGATNAKGSSDAKILAAIADLKSRGEPVTVARIRAMTGCNRLAVLRHVPTSSDANSSSTSAATPESAE